MRSGTSAALDDRLARSTTCPSATMHSTGSSARFRAPHGVECEPHGVYQDWYCIATKLKNRCINCSASGPGTLMCIGVVYAKVAVLRDLRQAHMTDDRKEPPWTFFCFFSSTNGSVCSVETRICTRRTPRTWRRRFELSHPPVRAACACCCTRFHRFFICTSDYLLASGRAV